MSFDIMKRDFLSVNIFFIKLNQNKNREIWKQNILENLWTNTEFSVIGAEFWTKPRGRHFLI